MFYFIMSQFRWASASKRKRCWWPQGIGRCFNHSVSSRAQTDSKENAYAKIMAGMSTSHARTHTKLRGKVRISTFSPITVIRISRIIVTKKDTGPISVLEFFSFYVEMLDRQYEYSKFHLENILWTVIPGIPLKSSSFSVSMSLTLFALIVLAISVSKNGDPKVLEVAIADLTVLKS